MKILVVNSGSSSIKFKLFAMPEKALLAAGSVERIGQEDPRFQAEVIGAQSPSCARDASISDHKEGLDTVIQWLLSEDTKLLKSSDDIEAVGHRVVHGAESFQAPTVIDSELLETLKECVALAPLHNPANILGIEVASALLPRAPQVAIFDTAFHQSLPEFAYRYAVPESFYRDYKVRRYGFHGTSHSYVAKEVARALDRPLQELNLITIHLGNGASITAIKNGVSVDTSMGLTPLEGLVMGTRSGDLDPAIPFYLMEEADLTTDEIDKTLNKESGLKGICGDSDMRDIEERAESGDRKAQLAQSMFCYRVKKYIGAYGAVLGRIDAIVFTAGIGENSSRVRALCCENLGLLGIHLDPDKNSAREGSLREIQSPDSAVRVFVVPTNEELEIAIQSYELLEKRE